MADVCWGLGGRGLWGGERRILLDHSKMAARGPRNGGGNEFGCWSDPAESDGGRARRAPKSDAPARSTGPAQGSPAWMGGQSKAGCPNAGPESALRPLDPAAARVVDGEVVGVGGVRQAELRRGIGFLAMPVSLFVQLVGLLLRVAFGRSVLCTFELHDASFCNAANAAKQVFPTRNRICISRSWCGEGFPWENCEIGAGRTAVFRTFAPNSSPPRVVRRNGNSGFRTPGGHPESPDDSGWPPPAGQWLGGCRRTRKRHTCRTRQAVGKIAESGPGWIRCTGVCLCHNRYTTGEGRRTDEVREVPGIRRWSTSTSSAPVSGICSWGGTFMLNEMAPGCLSETGRRLDPCPVV